MLQPLAKPGRDRLRWIRACFIFGPYKNPYEKRCRSVVLAVVPAGGYAENTLQETPWRAGWLGVAVTGSDTASNVLFGGLQRVTSEQLGISPILMSAANSSGGVMGKMIDAQSIVVASTATGWFGHESTILRFVFLHSIFLASLVGGLVMLQAYVWPFTAMVIVP